MLKCKDVANETSNYIDGTLPLTRRLALWLHLAICRYCRRYVQQMQQTVTTIALAQPKEKEHIDKQALAKRLHASCQNTRTEQPD